MPHSLASPVPLYCSEHKKPVLRHFVAARIYHRVVLTMNTTLRYIIALFLFSLPSMQAMAVGECGMACCLAGAGSSGVTLARNIGLSAQYEYMDMETIRTGTDEVSPDEVLDTFWTMGNSYSVPTRMVMEKLNLLGVLPVNERWQAMAIMPFVHNDMDMKMRMPMGMEMDMEMETVSGLGDITFMGLYTAYTDAPIRPSERLSLGFGIKMPTGQNETRTPMGHYVHAMMQAGSGSWDGIFVANYMRAWYPFVLQLNGFYHLTTESDTGYEFGDQLGVDIIGRYQVAKYVNLGLELNGIHAGQDKDRDGEYSRVATSMLDNTDHTGLTSWFTSVTAQFKFPGTGSNLGIKYQVPVKQDVEGYQQVVDERIQATLSWAM